MQEIDYSPLFWSLFFSIPLAIAVAINQYFKDKKYMEQNDTGKEWQNSTIEAISLARIVDKVYGQTLCKELIEIWVDNLAPFLSKQGEQLPHDLKIPTFDSKLEKIHFLIAGYEHILNNCIKLCRETHSRKLQHNHQYSSLLNASRIAEHLQQLKVSSIREGI